MPMQPQPGEVPPEVQKQMPSPRGQAPEENPEGAPTDILGELQKALFQTNQAIQGSSLPKEAQAHIANAYQEYSAGLKIIGSAMGVPVPDGGEKMTMGQQPQDMAGRSGAVSADMPMGKGIRAVPA